MDEISITIYGEPQAKGRPRFARRGKFMSTYTPEKTVVYENLVRTEYDYKYPGQKFGDDVPLEFFLKAFYAIPQSASKKKRIEMNAGFIRPTKKKDIDNVCKICMDALNNVAYRDDAQIVGLFAQRFYSDNPRVEIIIREAI